MCPSKKLSEIKGWLETDEKPKQNIPNICPKCGRKLNHADALQTCNIYFVYCMNLNCRWCEIYEE